MRCHVVQICLHVEVCQESSSTDLGARLGQVRSSLNNGYAANTVACPFVVMNGVAGHSITLPHSDRPLIRRPPTRCGLTCLPLSQERHLPLTEKRLMALRTKRGPSR
jgi:hypothetical protein